MAAPPVNRRLKPGGRGAKAAAPVAGGGAQAAAPVAAPSLRQTQVSANFNTAILPFFTATSDRFVYSQMFAPLDVTTFGTNAAAGGFYHHYSQTAAGAVGGTGQAAAASAAQAAAAAAQAAGAAAAQAAAEAPAAQVAAEAPAAQVAAGVTVNTLPQLQSQFGSTVGLLFLDRTRIVPQSSVLGEELMSLSLAPGETVVLEQQTFSKKTVSFEQQDETDQQVDLQYDATLTTALEEGLTNQQENSNKTTAGISGVIGGKFGPVSITASPNFSNTVSSADSTTQQQSVKNTTTASQQVSSTYRVQHKTVMRISTEQTFQNTSQRTITNPNRFTPIDLRYFKVYQRLQLSLERYGVRLAWGPTVQNPGQVTLAGAQQAYNQVIEAAVTSAGLPAQPTAPAPPPTLASQSVSATPQTVQAGNTFGVSNGYRNNLSFTIDAPSGYQWDGSAPTIWWKDTTSNSFSLPGGGGCSLNSATLDASGNLLVSVHGGWNTDDPVQVGVSANFVQIPTSANATYQQAYGQYQQALSAWQTQASSIQAAAAAGARTERSGCV